MQKNIKQLILQSYIGILTPGEEIILNQYKRELGEEQWADLEEEALLEHADRFPKPFPMKRVIRRRPQLRKVWMLLIGGLLVICGFGIGWLIMGDRKTNHCTATALPEEYLGAMLVMNSQTITELSNVIDYDGFGFVHDGPGNVQVRKVGPTGSVLHIRTEPRQQITFTLPDGTTVKLHASSGAEYAKRGDTMHLEIKGQAIITRPDSAVHPMIVHTALQDFILSQRSSVAVAALPQYGVYTLMAGQSGMLQTANGTAPLLREPGDQFIMQRDGRNPYILAVNRSAENVETAIAWTKPYRNYRNAPLRDCLLDITNWYGVRLENYSCFIKDKRMSMEMCYSYTLAEGRQMMEKMGCK